MQVYCNKIMKMDIYAILTELLPQFIRINDNSFLIAFFVMDLRHHFEMLAIRSKYSKK